MGWMVVVAAELIAAEAGLGFLLIKAYWIFRIYVMIAVMFWFYYASAAVFLGAEFVRASSEDGDACAQRRETKP